MSWCHKCGKEVLSTTGNVSPECEFCLSEKSSVEVARSRVVEAAVNWDNAEAGRNLYECEKALHAAVQAWLEVRDGGSGR